MSLTKKNILKNIPIFIPLAIYIYTILSNNLENSYFFFIYNAIIIFSLPFVISKYIYKRTKVEIGAGFLFLIYPIIYFFSFVISKILPIELPIILTIASSLLILKWNLIIILLSWNTNIIEKFFKEHIHLIIVIAIYSTLFFFLRDIDTIISLDYLQHISVSEKMKVGEQLCLTPNQCSELFLKLGYTTIYHTIFGFLTIFSNENPLRSMFFVDLIYPLTIGGSVFYILKKFTKNKLIVAIFSLISILIYVNGTYENTLFLPQTLAFLIFLTAMIPKKLNLKTVILTTILLTFTHFVMGPFLSFFLILKYLIIDKIEKKELKKYSKYIYFFALFTPLMFLIISSSGFSFESAFQQADLKIIGGFTNMPFPYNLKIYAKIFGGVGVFLLFSIIFQQYKYKPWYIYSLILTSITLCLYLLGPTYANKFLMGISITSVILMLKYLENLKGNKNKVLICIILLVFIIPNFYLRYSESLDFYRQKDGIGTAVPQKNLNMLNHLRTLENLDCIFVSDPLTQIQIEGIGTQPTANAQYILPISSKYIYRFVNQPNQRTYEDLKNIKELKGRKMCFVYSSTLQTALKRNDTTWLSHMYSLPKDSSVEIQQPSLVKYFLLTNQYEITHQDSQFIVFIKN